MGFAPHARGQTEKSECFLALAAGARIPPDQLTFRREHVLRKRASLCLVAGVMNKATGRDPLQYICAIHDGMFGSVAVRNT